MEIEIIDRVKDCDRGTLEFVEGSSTWNIALCSDGTLGFFADTYQESFLNGVKQGMHVRLIQSYDDGKIIYHQKSRGFVLRSVET